MANFNEHALEMSIMELFKDEEYTYVSGDQIHRERTEVLLTDDLKQYLYNRYAKDGITPSEVDSVILMLRNISGTIYEANKAVFKLLCDGFILNREDRTQKDLYIELIDFDTPENNLFKVVNQFEIEGVNNQLRIPDGIVFVNGIPVVVLEFKSAVQENTTIMDAYKQLTIRYRRDIPEIFKYNAFVVISDGANNKYGSFFSPYDFFYAWRKIEADDKELDGINSLVTMVSGLFRKERLLAVIKDFVYFPDSSDKDLKIVCRYPQYFAAVKLFENIKTSMFRFAAGYISSVAVAVVLGLILGRLPKVFRYINPAVQLLRPISPTAWMPFIVLLFGIGDMPAVVIIFIAAFFPVLLSTVGAVANIDPIYLKVAKNFGIKQPELTWKVILPAAFPQIANGIHLALGTAWIFLVAGEMVGAQSGLGYQIIDARNNIRADILLATIFVIGVIGILLDGLLKLIEKQILKSWGGVH